MHEIWKAFPPIFCSILTVVHALTGCDSTSALYYIGKKSVFKVALDHCYELQDISLILTEAEKATTAQFKCIALLYDPKGKYKNMHALREESSQTNVILQ